MSAQWSVSLQTPGNEVVEEELATFWYHEAVRLQTQANALLRDLAEREQTARTRHQNDILVISHALLEEADDRGWCDEFDKFVKNVNKGLNIELTERIKEYRITKTYLVTVNTIVECTPAEIDAKMEEYEIDDFITHINEADEIEEYRSDYEEQ